MTFCSRLVIRVCDLRSDLPQTGEESTPQINQIMEFPTVIENIVIGSHPAVNLRLESLEVSGVHARIIRNDDQFSIEDLTSRNGTELNGKRILPGTSAMIVQGDRIRIGHFLLDINFCETQETRHETTLADRGSENSIDVDEIIERFALPAQYPKLLMSQRSSGVAQPLVLESADRHYSLGRHASCDYVIDSPAVSRRHASVFRTTDDHVFIMDCGSSNGILVNGKQIRGTQELQNGDRIEIGPMTCELDLPLLDSIKINSCDDEGEKNNREPVVKLSSPERATTLNTRLIPWLMGASAIAGAGSLIVAVWCLIHLL